MHDVGLSEAHRFLQMLRHPQTIRLCWPGCRGPKPRIRSCKGCNGHGDWRERQDRCSGGSNIRRSTTVAHAGAAREGARWAREARIEGRSDMQRRPIGATKVVTNVWPHFPSQPTCFSYIFPSFFALRWVTQKEFYMIASWLQVASSENCEFLSLQRLAAPCSALQVEGKRPRKGQRQRQAKPPKPPRLALKARRCRATAKAHSRRSRRSRCRMTRWILWTPPTTWEPMPCCGSCGWMKSIRFPRFKRIQTDPKKVWTTLIGFSWHRELLPSFT